MASIGTVNIISYASDYTVSEYNLTAWLIGLKLLDNAACLRCREQNELILSIRMLKFHTKMKLDNYKRRKKEKVKEIQQNRFVSCLLSSL